MPPPRNTMATLASVCSVEGYVDALLSEMVSPVFSN